ncbi:hypothetical protein [Plesiocystis pacifica]|nr:hypothetical protein [Plesiocystis pacifica]
MNRTLASHRVGHTLLCLGACSALSLACVDSTLPTPSADDETGESEDEATSEDTTESTEDDTTESTEDDTTESTEDDATESTEEDTETDTGFELSPEDLAEIAAIPGELQLIVLGAFDFFEIEQTEPGPLHKCPHPDGVPLGGESGDTPPMLFNCNSGPEGKCIPVIGGGGAGYYDHALWADNIVWQGVDWMRPVDVPHEFRYNVQVVNEGFGYGACEVIAEAWADFDDDAEFSHYSLMGFIDEDGASIFDLVVEDPHE